MHPMTSQQSLRLPPLAGIGKTGPGDVGIHRPKGGKMRSQRGRAERSEISENRPPLMGGRISVSVKGSTKSVGLDHQIMLHTHPSAPSLRSRSRIGLMC
jgi:hypothetical protein